MNKGIISATRSLGRRPWISVLAALGFLKSGSLASAQEAATRAAPGGSALEYDLVSLRCGPLDVHPRATAGVTYDDNVFFRAVQPQSDVIWTVQPGVQFTAGDDAALAAYRDNGASGLSLSAGNLILQPPEAWTGKLVILDYSPRFRFYDRYSGNNSIDQLAGVNLLWPLSRLIVGGRLDYTRERAVLVTASQLATTETIAGTASGAYQFSEKTSVESDLHFTRVSYDQPGLTGYTEFSTENWLNFAVAAGLHASAGLLAGQDEVSGGQNQTFEQLNVRARYDYSEKLAFDASVGGELRQYANGLAATLKPVFSLSAGYRATERTTVRLTGYRQQSAAIFNGYNYTSTGATLSLQQGFTDRFTGDLSFGYYILDYQPTTTALVKYTDDSYTARLGLTAKIVRHLTGQLYYQWTSLQSPRGGNVNDNQIGAQMTLNY